MTDRAPLYERVQALEQENAVLYTGLKELEAELNIMRQRLLRARSVLYTVLHDDRDRIHLGTLLALAEALNITLVDRED